MAGARYSLSVWPLCHATPACTSLIRNRTPWLSEGFYHSIRLKISSTSSNLPSRQRHSPNPFRQRRNGRLSILSFAKSLCPKLKGVLPVWRKLFGLGLQADSSTGERCSLRGHEPSSAELQAKAVGHQKMALESTLPPHNDGVARRVSCPSRVRDASCPHDNRFWPGRRTEATEACQQRQEATCRVCCTRLFGF